MSCLKSNLIVKYLYKRKEEKYTDSNSQLKCNMPPMGIEPMTPSLRDWCSAPELKRQYNNLAYSDGN